MVRKRRGGDGRGLGANERNRNGAAGRREEGTGTRRMRGGERKEGETRS